MREKMLGGIMMMKIRDSIKYLFAVICFAVLLLWTWRNEVAAAEPAEIYLDSISGNDSNSGLSADQAVQSFDKAYELAGSGGTIYPTSDILLKDKGELTIKDVTIAKKEGVWNTTLVDNYLLNIRGNTNLTLEGVTLDGGNVAGSYQTSGWCIMNAENGNAPVLNIQEGTVFKNTVGDQSIQRPVLLQNGSTLNMYGGEMTGNTGGYVVFIGANSTFNMYGGAIKDNQSNGIFINSLDRMGNFNMYGGVIENNTANASGGAVNNSGGNMLLKGGIIRNNKATYGGGVSLSGWGENILDGTEITGNATNSTSGNGGGGIAIFGYYPGSTPPAVPEEKQITVLEIKSGSITDNTSVSRLGGGGIYVYASDNSCYIDISGGTISGNKATAAQWKGDAIIFYEASGNVGTPRLSGSPKISGDIYLTATGMAEVIDTFTPDGPITLTKASWTDYKPIVKYAQGLTADVTQFAARDDQPRWGYIKETNAEILDCINKKIVTFKNGDDTCGTLYINPQEKIASDQIPQITEREGYTLAGWSTADGKMWDLNNDTVTDDITLTAVWRENIKVVPADMTIYTGGESGYTGVVSDEGGTFVSSESLPEPGFNITLPAEAGAAEDLVFQEKNAEGTGYTGKEWKLELYGEGASDLYRLVPAGEGQDPVRVSFTDAQGKMMTNDSFDMEEALSVEYSIAIYSGSVDQGKIVAVTQDGTEYTVETAGSGKLTVRGVTGTEEVAAVTETEPSSAVSSVTAAAPADTEYTINNSSVRIPANGKPSLLVDEVARGSETLPLLMERAEQEIGADETQLRQYEFKYLDLVDAYNGNMWISSSKGTDIYWPYPEGTDEKTEFTILHYKGLHRSNLDEDNLAGEIAGGEVEVFSAAAEGEMALENTEKGIKFHVSSGNFSPFALVWDTPTGSLKVTNLIKGEGADLEKAFTFGVTLSDDSISGNFGEMEFENGYAEFRLKDGESKTASGLLAGIAYTVKEIEADKDGYKTSSEGAIGTIEKDMTAEAVFTNSYGKDQENTGDTGKAAEKAVKTGDNAQIAVWVLLLGVSLCILLAPGAYRKMKSYK